MRDALDAYRVAQQRRGLSKETIARRKYTYWAFEAWLGRDILTATREEIETWLDSLGLAPRARYCYISNLHTLYDFCVREQYMEVDPTLKIERPKLPRNVPRPVSEADLAHALSLAPPRERAMISLGAYEGLRCKEIAALEREDIEARPLWKPMHLQPVFAECRMYGGSVSAHLFERGLCLPSGSSLTRDEQERVIEIVAHCGQAAARR